MNKTFMTLLVLKLKTCVTPKNDGILLYKASSDL